MFVFDVYFWARFQKKKKEKKKVEDEDWDKKPYSLHYVEQLAL